MGCCLSKRHELSESNLQSAEKRVLNLSKLPKDQIKQIYAQIGEHDSEPINIRTTMIGKDENPILVIVHGYGSTGPLYFKTFQYLAKTFYVLLIDVIGMGASSRPKNYDYYNISHEKSTEYFVEFIESWRQNVAEHLGIDELKDFFIAGHSLGGWIVGNYMVKYHRYVKKAILLSPIGLKQEKEFDPNWAQSLENDTGIPPIFRHFHGIISWAWKLKISPFQLYRGVGQWVSMHGIKLFIKRRKYVTQEDEITDVQDLMYQSFLRPGTTEYAIFIDFKVGLQAHAPLTSPDKLGKPDFDKPLSFIYGELDWCPNIDKDAFKIIINANKNPDKCRHYILPQADHNLHFDNPEDLSKIMIQDLLSEN